MNISKTAIASAVAAAALGTTLMTVAPAASALQEGDILVRARLIDVIPNDDSGLVSAAGAPVAGSGVTVDDGITLDIDFTYMVTKNIGAELLLDLSSKHEVSSSGTLAAIAPGEIIEAYVLPPSLVLQYHFLPDNNIRPYVGAGINYTKFLGAKATPAAKNLAGLSNVDLDSSIGFVGQVGVDIDLNESWFLNFDVKYIDVNTTATANSALGRLRVDVDIDPWVVGVGVGMRF